MNESTINRLANSITSNILDLHLLPTEQCNFRCTYCYESFHLKKMSPLVIGGIKKLLAKRINSLKSLRIAWFGGEPLAASDVVLDISKYAMDLCLENFCHYHFSMTTNAYLLDEDRFAALLSVGVDSFQISLDGPKELHDRTRKRADGGGTFDKIWANLIAASENSKNFTIILRVHITPDNFTKIPALIGKLNSSFANDGRFKIFLKSIENLGGPTSGSFSVLSFQQKKKILADLQALVHPNLQYSLEKNNISYICYAASANAWVIRSDGGLAKCTVLFDDDRNKVGQLCDDGTFVMHADKIKLWLRGLQTNDKAQLACPAYQLPQL